MDFEQNNNTTEPAPPQPPEPIPPPVQSVPPGPKRPKRRIGWKIFWGIILALSVLANIVLVLMLSSVVALFATGQRDVFTEEVIQAGPRTTKIAVIKVGGIIDDEKAGDVYRQLKRARKDKRVKGLIIRVNSPGGTIAASDQIYSEILKYRRVTNKPVVAFMQGIAASGGYYVSVGSNTIVAEPTTITGSIGVIFGHFVIEKLLKEKLGIQPHIITAGEKKDWPSLFQAFTKEQQEYLEERLIRPAYERFVQVVDRGRPSLTVDDVRRLADGSIYGAQEARDKKLIDKIGYLDEAIKTAMSLAGVEEAQVVEYRKPFSLAGLLSAQSRNILKIDKTTLYELSTPQLLYLWAIPW
jgi:protease-4